MIRLVYGEDRHSATVRTAGDEHEVTVDGAVHQVVVEAVGPSTFLLRTGTRTETFHCVRDGDDIHLAWRGVSYLVQQEREGARTTHRQQSGGLEAPMPGKVIKLSVEPGQQVRKGDEVLVIEAMKMENALRSPRDGVVKSVAAKVGDMVNPGVVLVDIE